MKSNIQRSVFFMFVVLLGMAINGRSQDVIKFTDEPENLGANINSAYSELGGIISPDGKTIYICRDQHPSNMGPDNSQDIWYATVQEDGSWGQVVQMHSPINTNGNNWISSITPDGNTVLLGKKYNYFDGSTSNGISLSTKDEKGWQYPKAQIIEKYENKGDYVNFYLANDAKTLLIAAELKKGEGKMDLWVSFKDKKEKNHWTKPINLGEVINTKGDESGPFLAADNKTLYFSTDGYEGGFGDADIWMSKRLDDSWTNWSEPVNLGDKINTPNWDSYFSIPASGEYAYFVSSKEGGYGNEDIWRIKLPQPAKPDPVVLIKGKVLNKETNEPIKANISYESLKSGELVGSAISIKGLGSYMISLPKGEAYGFTASAEGFYAISENIDLRELNEYREIERNIYMAPVKKGVPIRLNNIFFDFGKASLKEESHGELNRLAKLLNENSSLNIEIGGHTDNVGSDEDNLSLSQQRTESVVNYLIEQGIAKSRLVAKGYGENVPIADNDTDEGKALNRRVEFKIL